MWHKHKPDVAQAWQVYDDSPGCHLECVAGQGDIGEGDCLPVGLPHFKVLEHHHSGGGLERFPLKLLPHHHLAQCCLLDHGGHHIQASIVQVAQEMCSIMHVYLHVRGVCTLTKLKIA